MPPGLGTIREEIAQQYPAVPLADVYTVIGFYLARRQQRSVPLGPAIEDLLLTAECSLPGEWEGQVRYLPL